jgi:hypothetical protein
MDTVESVSDTNDIMKAMDEVQDFVSKVYKMVSNKAQTAPIFKKQ